MKDLKRPRILPENNFGRVWHIDCEPGDNNGVMKPHGRDHDIQIEDGSWLRKWECLKCGEHLYAGLDSQRFVIVIDVPGQEGRPMSDQSESEKVWSDACRERRCSQCHADLTNAMSYDIVNCEPWCLKCGRKQVVIPQVKHVKRTLAHRIRRAKERGRSTFTIHVNDASAILDALPGPQEAYVDGVTRDDR